MPKPTAPPARRGPITGRQFYNVISAELTNSFPAAFLARRDVQRLLLFFNRNIEDHFDRIEAARNTMHTIAKLLCLAALFTSASYAQLFGGRPAPQWARSSVTCSAAPNFDLKAATAFDITLCATPATATVSNVSLVDGKIVSFLICQDATGSKVFTWPADMFGTADIPTMPARCLAQSFMVAGTQLWAVSTGAQQTTVPVPSALRVPLVGGSTFPSSSLALTNESGGVAFTIGADSAFPRGFGQTRTAGSTTISLMAFWITQSSGTTNMFGFTNARVANGTNDAETCGYEGTGTDGVVAHRMLNQSDASIKNTWGSASVTGHSFTDASHPLLVRYTQTGTAGGTAKCEASIDFGATWINLGTRPSDYFGTLAQGYWAVGGIFAAASGTTMHLSALSVE